jgi:hypothetical protein
MFLPWVLFLDTLTFKYFALAFFVNAVNDPSVLLVNKVVCWEVNPNTSWEVNS